MATRRRKKHRLSRPSRKDMIAALGLDPEGSSRQQKYAATTAEFWSRIRNGSAPSAEEARKKLGFPTIPGSTRTGPGGKSQWAY